MLRRRVITVLTFVDGVLFRTKLFEPDYRYTLNFVDAWSVDEIVVLDVTRNPQADRTAFDGVVQNFARNCFVPLAAGGGIRDLGHVRRYLDLGADKVVVNTGALERPELITEVARAHGSQCCVVSIDARRTDGRTGEGGYEVCSTFGGMPTGQDPVAWAREAVDRGAGEIMITAIEHDGALSGYDLELCRRVADAVPVPVLICGGAGNWKHFLFGFQDGGADAVCTTNIYHFTETSIQSAKAFLAKNGVPVRVSQ